MVTASILGIVVDESNQPMEGVTVCLGTKSLVTKADGVFSFEDASVPANRAYVCATKTGFFPGSRMMMVRAGGKHLARIMMLEKTLAGSFSNTSGGNVETTDGLKVSFPANATGSNGDNVQVYAKLLSASDPDLLSMMPGDLRGINSDGDEEAMASFGMIAVELTDGSGLKTNLAPGKEAEISLPIPADMQANAPNTIPLWHFDEATGMWQQDGEATKSGDRYIGKVSHFSFWNCDIGWPLVQL
jgi:hypothetical protein